MFRKYFVFPLTLWIGSAVLSSAHAADPCSALPPATSVDFQTLLQGFLDNACYQKENWKHDPKIRTTNGVHPNVQVYYSPTLWNWLTVGKREGDVPDGAMLVKAQFGDPAHPSTLTDWAIMVKDRDGSWDGWYWADLAPSSDQVSPPPAGPHNGPNCHRLSILIRVSASIASTVTSPPLTVKARLPQHDSFWVLFRAVPSRVSRRRMTFISESPMSGGLLLKPMIRPASYRRRTITWLYPESRLALRNSLRPTSAPDATTQRQL